MKTRTILQEGGPLGLLFPGSELERLGGGAFGCVLWHAVELDDGEGFGRELGRCYAVQGEGVSNAA